MSLTLPELEKKLQDAGSLPRDWQEEEEQFIPTPWFVSIMTGIGAWLTTASILALFLLSSLTHVGGIRSGLILAMTGCALGVFMYLTQPIHEFSRQLRIALSIVGQCLFFVGIYLLFKNIYVLIGAIVVIEFLLMLAYRENILQFLACWTILAALVYLLEYSQWVVGVHVLVSAIAIGVVYIDAVQMRWIATSRAELIYVIYHALLFGLLIIMLFSIPIEGMFELDVGLLDTQWTLSGLLLGAVLVGLVWRILQQWHVPVRSPWTFAILGLVTVLAVMSLFVPATTAGLLLLCLGFKAGDRTVQLIALLYILVFVVIFIYVMQTSLLLKSYVLLLLGGLFLLTYLVLSRMYKPIADHADAQ